MLEAVFVFFFVLCSSVSWLAFSGSAQVSLTWLNLLSAQPRGRTAYRFHFYENNTNKSPPSARMPCYREDNGAVYFDSGRKLVFFDTARMVEWWCRVRRC